MIRLSWVFLLVLLLPQVSWAQGTNDFTVQVFGSADTLAPSTPVVTSVVPVTTSQIDLSWSTSTDNFLVFGYVVYRDGVPVATTTAPGYSDTGLAASTTYAYQVAAFDGVPNYSSSSTAVATTTPAVVVPPVPGSGSSQGTRARVVLAGDIAIVSGIATATIAVTTNNIARIEVRLGQTSSYEQSSIVGQEFQTQHQIYLNDLVPVTTYYYQVIGYAPSGGQTTLQRGTFTTQSDQPPPAPTNVAGLVANQQGSGVQLAYQLPADFPGAGVVRVVRSHLGYPQFMNDGVVVYEGTARQVFDPDAFTASGQAYYTVFVVDRGGLISSGAIVLVTDQRVSTTVAPDLQAPATPVQPAGNESVTPAATTTQTPASTSVAVTGFPEPADFIVTQNDTTFSASAMRLSAQTPFTLAVPATAITGDFKTIVATLTDPRDQTRSFSFLLRLNTDQTSYTATIAPLLVAGLSQLTVEVFDYDTKVISQYSTPVEFVDSGVVSTTTPAWYWRVQSWLWLLVLVVPVGVLGLLSFLFYKRERQDEDNGTV